MCAVFLLSGILGCVSSQAVLLNKCMPHVQEIKCHLGTCQQVYPVEDGSLRRRCTRCNNALEYRCGCGTWVHNSKFLDHLRNACTANTQWKEQIARIYELPARRSRTSSPPPTRQMQGVVLSERSHRCVCMCKIWV